MSKNLTKRIITSIFLLSILFFINFSHQYVFILWILILGIFICFEANNIFSKLFINLSLKKNSKIKKINFNFLILNLLTFCYVFLIFCNFSYEIHKLQGSYFFLYLICICFFSDIGGYTFGKIIGGKKLSKISPNKTISGTIGSFIFSIIPLIIFINFDNLDLQFNIKYILFTLLISLISQLGDLFI